MGRGSVLEVTSPEERNHNQEESEGPGDQVVNWEKNCSCENWGKCSQQQGGWGKVLGLASPGMG